MPRAAVAVTLGEKWLMIFQGLAGDTGAMRTEANPPVAAPPSRP